MRHQFMRVPSTVKGFGSFVTPASTPSNTPSSGELYASASGNSIVAKCSTFPYLIGYGWSSLNKFGSLYTQSTYPNLGGYGISNIALSPNSSALVYTYYNGSPYIVALSWSDPGFGSQYQSPATVPYRANGISFSRQGNAVITSKDTTPFIWARSWSDSGGFGAAYADPSTPLATSFSKITFSQAGTAFAVGLNASPWLKCYSWSSATGIGAEISTSAYTLNQAITKIAFSPTDQALGLITNTNFAVYTWSAAGTGSRYTNPVSFSTLGLLYDFSFAPSGSAVAFVHSSSPYISVYEWSDVTGFGAKYPNPTIAFSYGPTSVAFSPLEDALFVAGNSSPKFSAYAWAT